MSVDSVTAERTVGLKLCFFSSVRNRLREKKFLIFPEFTILVTGYGKLRSYLHRFGITDNARAKKNEQTSDHLIFQCKRLNNQRNVTIKQIKSKVGDYWPTTNEKTC
jgi:hypothetical protein